MVLKVALVVVLFFSPSFSTQSLALIDLPSFTASTIPPLALCEVDIKRFLDHEALLPTGVATEGVRSSWLLEPPEMSAVPAFT